MSALQALTATLQPLAVSIPEAARLLGISPHTVRHYIREDKIRVVRYGRKITILMTEIERLAREGVPPQPDLQATPEGVATQ